MLVGDVSGDGLVDLVVAEGTNNSVSVSLGLGGGSYAPRTTLATWLNPMQLALGDVTADGKLDLVVTEFGHIVGYTYCVLPGVGQGAFGPRVAFPSGFDPFDVALADFDGDGQLDVAVSCNYSPCVDLRRGGSERHLEARDLFGAGDHCAGLVVADFNADGRLDLAVANTGANSVSVMLQ